MGSVNSTFQFINYKIDSLSLTMPKSVGLLNYQNEIRPSNIKFQIRVRQPLFFETALLYVGGLELRLFVYGDENTDAEQQSESDAILSIELGIEGLFSVQNGRFASETEENLVKFQIPALLMPYIRSTLTNLFANCGFGSIILPLINIHELVKQSASNLSIQVSPE